MPRSLAFFAKLGHGGGGTCLFTAHLESNNGDLLVIVWIADWLVTPGPVLHDSPAQNIYSLHAPARSVKP